MYQTLLLTEDGPIATITLNRPEALNTIVPPMPDEVEDAVNVCVRNDDVKVIILRGVGVVAIRNGAVTLGPPMMPRTGSWLRKLPVVGSA